MVSGFRLAEVSRGNSIRTEFDVEKEAVKYARRSVVSLSKIPKGTIISREMLGIKRPGTGIPPKFFEKIIGSRALKNIEDDAPINFEDISL